VQASHPPHALALQVGEQVRAQQFLHPVGLPPRPGGRHQGGLVLELVEHAAGLFATAELGSEPGRYRVTDADHTHEFLHVHG
jgi:hypothetical protein